MFMGQTMKTIGKFSAATFFLETFCFLPSCCGILGVCVGVHRLTKCIVGLWESTVWSLVSSSGSDFKFKTGDISKSNKV